MSDDERLTCAQLAARIGSRFRGRPTHPDTVRDWMLHGLAGVLLPSQVDPVLRTTTWRDYLRWREKVARRREELREERLEAVKRTPAQRRRQEAARRELERQGVR